MNKLAEPAITSYFTHLVREEGVEKICFLLIPKSLRNITRLLADIQKKWLEFCLEELKSLTDKNVYEVENLPKG